MTHRQTRRGLVVSACLLAVFGAGCTPADPAPASPSSSVPSPTPTENPQEREERLAYAAAETSYRDFRAEFYRVLRAGGSQSATAEMKATGGGPYLKEAIEIVQAYEGEQGHSTGQEKVVSVHGNGYSVDELVLTVCDDTTDVRTFDKKGQLVGRGEFRTSELTVHRVDGIWKIWSGKGRGVAACDA